MQEEIALFLNQTHALVAPFATGSQIKDAEIYISQFRRNEPGRAFAVCCAIANLRSGPESLLAAHTIVWVCENTNLAAPQLSGLVDQLMARCTSYDSLQDAVVQKLTRALASSIILSHNTKQFSRDWLYSDCRAMIAGAKEGGGGAQAQRSVLSVVTALPEASCSKGLVEFWSRGVEGSSSSLGKILLCERVLGEVGAAVDLTEAVMAAGDLASLALGARCCTAWLERAEDALSDVWEVSGNQTVSAEMSAAAAQAGKCAVHCLQAWSGSKVVQGVLQCLEASDGSGAAYLAQEADAHEACLGMLVALCKAAVCDGPRQDSAPPHKSAGRANRERGEGLPLVPAIAEMSASTQGIAAVLAVRLLPTLPALLVSTTQQLRSVAAQQSGPLSAQVMEQLCAVARRGTQCAVESADLLLHRSCFIHCAVTAEGASWKSFLALLVAALEDHLAVWARVSAMGRTDLRATAREHSQVCVESALPFIASFAEKVASLQRNLSAGGAEQSTQSAAGLQRAAAAALERLAFIAIRACAYPRDCPDAADGLQAGEDFEEFRNYVRDWLRTVAELAPGLALWLVGHTAAQLALFEGDPVASDCAWDELEALLHGLTAITKPVLSALRDDPAGSQQLRAHLGSLLQSLVRSDACCACRPLSRMCVVLFAELLPAVFVPAQQATGGDSAGASMCAAGLWRQFCSLQHCEVVSEQASHALAGVFGDAPAPADRLMHQGRWIAFRVKQDHIGAVSLLKLVARFAQAQPPLDAELFCELPGMLALVSGDHPVETVMVSAGRAIREGGLRGTSLALLTYVFLNLLRIQPMPRPVRTLSDKSAALVVDALCAALAPGRLENVAAFLVPVGAATLAALSARTSGPTPYSGASTSILSFAQQLASPLCAGTPDSSAPVVQAAAQLAERLAEACSLTQLLGMLDKLVTARTQASGRIGPLAVLVVMETCLPVLQGISALARTSTGGEPSEIDAAGALFASCCCCVPAPEAACTGQESSVRAVAWLQAVSATVPLPEQHTPAVARWLEKALLIPAAELIRSLACLGREAGAEVAVEQLTHGVSHACMQRLGSFAAKEAGSLLERLLQFWKAGLAASELLLGNKAQVKLPASVATLATIIEAVCSLAESTLQCDRTPAQSNGFTLTTGAWRDVFHVFALVCGPVGSIDCSCSALAMDNDGVLTAASVKVLGRSSLYSGIPQLTAWLVETGYAVRIALMLVSCLLMSGPAEQAGRYVFPSQLREECIAVLTKLVLALGVANAGPVLGSAVQQDSCPVNGTLAREAGRAEWVQRTVNYAGAGDWKKFKSSIKILCRG